MKKIFIVISYQTPTGERHASALTIKAGENIIPFIKRYKADVCHVCEGATQAHYLAAEWNKTYKENGEQ